MRPAVRRVTCGVLAGVVLFCSVTVEASHSSPAPVRPQQGLINAAPLARIYRDIMDARFEQAELQLRQGCGGAPPIACQILGTVLTWWRIQMDPASTALDATLRDSVDRSVAAADEWTRREPKRGEAWFYLGAAYAVRVQFRALRLERLAAARDGKRIKDALERALALDPSINDAYFGIGLYHYYADVAPTVLKFLRFLLLLPGGDRVQGMSEMLQTRDRGELLRGEADYQIHLLYLWYENQPAKALDLLRGLRATYPHNPLFLKNIAEVQDVYFHDAAASLATWETLLAEARARRVGIPEVAEVWAREGMAAQLEVLAESDRAIEDLRPIVQARPPAPAGATARAALAMGRAYDRLGDRFHAIESYRIASTTAPRDDPDRVRARAAEGLRRGPGARKAEAYRLSIEGWRHLERRSFAQATLALERSLALDGADPVTHFRYGRLLQARGGDDPRALAEFEIAVAMRPYAPAAIRAAAYLESGRVLESRGDRTRALDMYAQVARVTGAEARTLEAAAKSIARLRTPSPSRLRRPAN